MPGATEAPANAPTMLLNRPLPPLAALLPPPMRSPNRAFRISFEAALLAI